MLRKGVIELVEEINNFLVIVMILTFVSYEVSIFRK